MFLYTAYIPNMKTTAIFCVLILSIFKHNSRVKCNKFDQQKPSSPTKDIVSRTCKLDPSSKATILEVKEKVEEVEEEVEENQIEIRQIQRELTEIRNDLKKEIAKALEHLKNLQISVSGMASMLNQPKQGKNCADLYSKDIKESGVYKIDPDGFGSFNVLCDMTTSSGGWTVFQRRLDGSVDFYRGWQDYKYGFGDLRGEFWLGLEKIHRLTTLTQAELRIDMEDTSGNMRYAEYDYFAVAGEKQKYKLGLGTYAGTAGDSFTYHKDLPFTTKDSDNDRDSRHCAVVFKGAWWYNSCHHSNLNGQYLHGEHKSYADGINWLAWKGYRYSLKSTSMKMRPRAFGLNR